MSKGSADFRYCNVQVRTWEDAKFKRLSKPPPNAQTLWFFLLCGGYTTRIPGVIHGGRAAMAETLDWDLEAFDACFGEIVGENMAVADWKSRLIYLPSAFRQPHNRPTSTNVAVLFRRQMHELPECDLRFQIEHDLRQMLFDISDDMLASYDGERRCDIERKRNRSEESKATASSVPANDARKDEPTAPANPRTSGTAKARANGSANGEPRPERLGGYQKPTATPEAMPGPRPSPVPIPDPDPDPIPEDPPASASPSGLLSAMASTKVTCKPMARAAAPAAAAVSECTAASVNATCKPAPNGTERPSALSQQAFSLSTAASPSHARKTAGPSREAVVQVLEWYNAEWVASRRPDDGKPPTCNKADWAQLRRLIAKLGAEETRELVRRYLADADPFLRKQGHPLRLLPCRVDGYRAAGPPRRHHVWREPMAAQPETREEVLD